MKVDIKNKPAMPRWRFKRPRKTVVSLKAAKPNYRLRLPPDRLGALLGAIDRSGSKAVHILSPYRREGSHLIAFETAYLAAVRGNRRVLFIDAAPEAQGVVRNLRARVQKPLGERPLLKASNDSVSPFIKIKGSGLYFAALHTAKDEALLDALSLAALFEKLKEKFDLIIVHSDMAVADMKMAGGLDSALAPLTDRAIIVAEAERTRLPVISRIRYNIEFGGGTVLGAVLNRRRYYIPRLLYAALYK